VIELKDVGRRVRCTKCGKEGVVRVVIQRKKDYRYLYIVVRHYNENRYCIIKRIDVKKIKSIEDVLKLIGELEELRKKTRLLEEENEQLKKELMNLRIENSMLKDKVESYEEILRKSIVITRNEKIEERIDEIKNLLKNYDGIRIIPFKYILEIRYGIEK